MTAPELGHTAPPVIRQMRIRLLDLVAARHIAADVAMGANRITNPRMGQLLCVTF